MEITALIEYIRQKISGQRVLSPLDEMMQNGSSTAGKSSREEVFTREFLCPALKEYFFTEVNGLLQLSDSEIKSGLGTEGYSNAPGFGFTPARKQKHLFRKTDIVKNEVPDSWTETDKKTRGNQACPDFAIRHPLPYSIVGEVKLFHHGSSESRVKKDLYDAARQAVFYLGAYSGEYENALIVVADATDGHKFKKGLDLVNPDIIDRFGKETKIYLAVIPLH